MKNLEADRSDSECYKGMRELRMCDYPGRIAIIGASRDSNYAQVAYALTGRSEGSRQRIFVDEGYGNVRTLAPSKSPSEMAKTKNAKLIYYRATQSGAGIHVVSNGAQTDPVYESIQNGSSLETAVRSAPSEDEIDLSSYEPDEPNYTPRITGVIDLRDDAPTPFGLAIVRRTPGGEEPEYAFHTLNDPARLPSPGVGYGIQTYSGDGNPLPSYNSAPFAFPLGHTAAETASNIWDELNPDRRVAVAVHSIDTLAAKVVETCIINSPS